jgi:hypothetical protein
MPEVAGAATPRVGGMVLRGNVGAAGTLATMHTYSETLARRIVAHVARASADDPTAWVMLHDAARHLKVAEESAVLAMRVAVAWGWLKAEGIVLYRVSLTPRGLALPRPH